MSFLNAVYTGENLIPSYFGHVCVLLSFLGSLFAVFSFTMSANKDSQSWNKLGRGGFYIHSLATFGVIGMLFYVMVMKMYEYRYAFEHVSDDLPMQYILSAFWEGQEGSFLLWMFWHIIIGFVLLRGKYKHESHVMAIFLLVQSFIASMILGVHIGGEEGFKLGSNPTLLLRQTLNAPIFSNPEYLSMITGDGLNPLLQNYWNVIHPPTLFIGFASVTVPFSFAISGLWSKDHKSWLAPALKWGLFSACILGTGILMGGAWAYVALSFGGYWAWDPVENMSLVPWLIMVAGVHTNLISKATGYSIKSTYLMYLLSFVLILYSTFLTRSGILGETSAHAFTEMGLEWQLVAFVSTFFIISLIAYFSRSRQIPSPKKEESIYSREFWMYIGSIVLLFSGVIIATSTSLPVYNSIASYFNPDFVGKVIDDPIPHFNKYQIWIACFVTLLSSVALALKFKGFGWEKARKKFWTHNLIILALSAVLTYLMTFWIDFFETRYYILNGLCLFALLSNVYLLFPNNWKSSKAMAAAVSHFGFAAMIVGTLASGLNEKVVTTNPFALSGLVQDEDLAKVITLIKDVPFFSEGYWIEYESDTVIGNTRIFDIRFKETDENEKVIDEFVVKPNVVFSNDLTKVAAPNPDTKNYLFKDIFVNIPSLPAAQRDVELAQAEEDSLEYVLYEMEIGDTVHLKESYGVLESITVNPQNENFLKEENELGLEAQFTFTSTLQDTSWTIAPALGLDKNLIYSYPERVNPLRVKAKIKEEYFDAYFTSDADIDYQEIVLGLGDTFDYKDWQGKLINLDRDPSHDEYEKEDIDIAVGAEIQMTHKVTGDTHIFKPIYIIRGTKPMLVKDYDVNQGIHVKFFRIDPKSEQFYFTIGLDERGGSKLPVFIAEDVPRSDWILLEALVFPGINLFWLGSILMMAGFAISLISRLKQKF